ncbi:MAG: tetratricopeptide repeat protein, partial [Nitrospira sp.]|nr:tetratricopeptide repeat protein [Nitrospira sp.]
MLLSRGDLDGATQAFEEVLKKSSMHPEANFYLGQILLRKNEQEAAIEHFKKVLTRMPDHLLSHYNIALAYRAMGRTEEAMTWFKRVIQIEPRYYPAHFDLGDLYERQEQVEDAVRSFQKVVELVEQIPEAQEFTKQTQARLVQLGGDPSVARQVLESYKKAQNALKERNYEVASIELKNILDRLVPQHVAARYLLAQIHLRQGQVLEAMKRLEEAVKIDLVAWRIYITLAQVYSGQGLYEEAILAYTAAATILKQGPIYEDIRREVISLREVTVERERLEQSRKDRPLREARNLFEKGITLLKDGKPEEAITQIKLAIEKNPDNSYFHYNLGIAYFNQQNFILATQALLKAINLNDKFGLAHFFLGLVYNASGDAGRNQGDLVGATQEYYKSVQELNRALELGVEEWAVDEARSRLSKFEKVIADFQEALGHAVLATALLERKDYDGAINEFRIAASLVPQDPASRISIGQIYETLGRDEEAIAVYQEAATASPQSPHPLVYLGEYYEKKKELEKAREAYQTAIERSPRAAQPLIRMGTLLYDQKETEKARENFEKAIKLDPRQVEAHFYMAQILEKEGQDAMAMVEYQQVVQFLPEGEASRQFALQRLESLRPLVGSWSHAFMQYDNNGNNSEDQPKATISNNFSMSINYRLLRLSRIHWLLPIPLLVPLDFQSNITTLIYTENIFNTETLSLSLQSNFIENYSLIGRYRFSFNYNDIFGPYNVIHGIVVTGNRSGKIPSRTILTTDFTSIDSLVTSQNDRVSYNYGLTLAQTPSFGKYGNASFAYTFSNRDYINLKQLTRTHALEIDYFKAPYGSARFTYTFLENQTTIRLEESGIDHRFSLGYSNTFFRKLGFTTGLDY